MLAKSAVNEALIKLLNKHGKESPSIDDLVLSYVCSILDDLSGEDEDLFDAEAFSETLSAYLPEAEGVSQQELKEWVFNLADEQAKAEEKQKKSNNIDLKRVIEATAVTKAKPEAVNDEKPQKGKRLTRLSETSDGGSSSSSSSSEGSSYEGGGNSSAVDGDWGGLVAPILEMFPYSCSLEVNHCLHLMAGDVERTAQLIMHRHETGQSLKPTDRKLVKIPKVTTDEKTVKNAILGKYGYVDKEEDARYHRPMIKKNDDKKLIRYRDGKIVSTKGERFTQVSKQESEEMKKTIKI